MYFINTGKENTDQVLELVRATARERTLNNIVVASVTGETAMRLADFEGNVVCVTHADGFEEKGQNQMAADMRAALTASGVKVLTTTHVLSGVERGLSNWFQGVYPAEIIAHTLRMFGQGTKVCVEVAVMALDAGLIPFGEKILVLAGTGHGLDTAVIMTPAHANDIFKVRVHEILCKPL